MAVNLRAGHPYQPRLRTALPSIRCEASVVGFFPISERSP